MTHSSTFPETFLKAYRYGFNGMEKDDELKGIDGGSYTTEFRQYDPRIGRWLSIDPKANSFPWISPLSFSNNNPLIYNDNQGDIPWPKIVNSNIIKSHLQVSRHLDGETKARPHQGLDISAKKGTEIHAAAGGKVIATSNSKNFKDYPNNHGDGGGWGNFVVIDHGNGYLTLYAHLEEGSMLVNVGDKVTNDQVIGKVGNSGHSYGPHAHVEAIFNEDGSSSYAGTQYKNSGSTKNAHVFSLEDIGDLQKIIDGKEETEVVMLDGTKKTLGFIKPVEVKKEVKKETKKQESKTKPKTKNDSFSANVGKAVDAVWKAIKSLDDGTRE